MRNSFFGAPRHATFRYAQLTDRNPDCIHVVLSTRAWNMILSEVLSFDSTETGGVLMGNIYQRVWYITDAIPPGISTQNSWAHFQWDRSFVEYMCNKTSNL